MLSLYKSILENHKNIICDMKRRINDRYIQQGGTLGYTLDEEVPKLRAHAQEGITHLEQIDAKMDAAISAMQGISNTSGIDTIQLNSEIDRLRGLYENYLRENNIARPTNGEWTRYALVDDTKLKKWTDIFPYYQTLISDVDALQHDPSIQNMSEHISNGLQDAIGKARKFGEKIKEVNADIYNIMHKPTDMGKTHFDPTIGKYDENDIIKYNDISKEITLSGSKRDKHATVETLKTILEHANENIIDNIAIINRVSLPEEPVQLKDLRDFAKTPQHGGNNLSSMTKTLPGFEDLVSIMESNGIEMKKFTSSLDKLDKEQRDYPIYVKHKLDILSRLTDENVEDIVYTHISHDDITKYHRKLSAIMRMIDSGRDTISNKLRNNYKLMMKKMHALFEFLKDKNTGIDVYNSKGRLGEDIRTFNSVRHIIDRVTKDEDA